MKKTMLVALATMMLGGVQAQTAHPAGSQQEQVLMTIDGEPIYLSEFEYIFSKNSDAAADNGKSESEKKKEYLELFTNFKLKVHEAHVLGYDTTESFRKEFEQYIQHKLVI